MMALIILVWLGFQGLAICTLGYILDMGLNPGNAIAIAVCVITTGALITRAMYRKTYVIETTIKVIPHKAISYPQTSLT